MGRQPSIHVTEEVLTTLIKEAFEWGNDGESIHLITRRIVSNAKVHSLSSRSIYVTNDKLLKKTDKLKLVNRSATGEFAQVLLFVRRKFKHRGLQLITPGDKDWLNIKEACKLATEFCQEFEMPRKKGYEEYISIGMTMMKNFSPYKFKSIHGAICNRFEAIQEIKLDKTPKETEALHQYYLDTISEKTGNVFSYKTIPEKYVSFVKAKETANAIGASGKNYIKAQFAAFEWTSGIPDPMQLFGDKARDRVQKWAFENNIRLGQGRKSVVNIFQNIKKHGKKSKDNNRK